MVYIPTMHIKTPLDFQREYETLLASQQARQVQQQQMQLAQMKQEAFMREQQQAQEQQRQLADAYSQWQQQQDAYNTAMKMQSAAPALQEMMKLNQRMVPQAPPPVAMPEMPKAPADLADILGDKMLAMGQFKAGMDMKKQAKGDSPLLKAILSLPTKLQERVPVEAWKRAQPELAAYEFAEGREKPPGSAWQVLYSDKLEEYGGDRSRAALAATKELKTITRQAGGGTGPGPARRFLAGKPMVYIGADGMEHVGVVKQDTRGDDYIDVRNADGTFSKQRVVALRPAPGFSERKVTEKDLADKVVELAYRKTEARELARMKAAATDPLKKREFNMKVEEKTQSRLDNWRKGTIATPAYDAINNYEGMIPAMLGVQEAWARGERRPVYEIGMLFRFIQGLDKSVVRASEAQMVSSGEKFTDRIEQWKSNLLEGGVNAKKTLKDIADLTRARTKSIVSAYNVRAAEERREQRKVDPSAELFKDYHINRMYPTLSVPTASRPAAKKPPKANPVADFMESD